MLCLTTGVQGDIAGQNNTVLTHFIQKKDDKNNVHKQGDARVDRLEGDVVPPYHLFEFHVVPTYNLFEFHVVPPYHIFEFYVVPLPPYHPVVFHDIEPYPQQNIVIQTDTRLLWDLGRVVPWNSSYHIIKMYVYNNDYFITKVWTLS